MKKALFIVIVILLLIAFGISAFLVGSYLLESKEQKEAYDALASQAAQNRETMQNTTAAPETTEATVAETTEETEPAETTEPQMIYKDAYEKNTDTVGWIRIEGTKVDYPVMQTPDDPNYYLHRTPDKVYNKNGNGSIYAWGAADINEPSDNITLFGHNMLSGQMFAGLHSYTSKDFWEKNSLIFFDTLYEMHTYKIYAVFTTSANLDDPDYFAYHQFVDAASEAEFDDFVETAKNMALYETGVTPVYGDKLIALSTCEYSHNNGRLVVCAVRIS